MTKVWRLGGKVYRNANGKVVRCATCPIDCESQEWNPVPPTFPDWPYTPGSDPDPEDYPADDLLYSLAVEALFEGVGYSSSDCSGSINNKPSQRRLKNGPVIVNAVQSPTPKWVGSGTIEIREQPLGGGAWGAWSDVGACTVTLEWVSGTPNMWKLTITNMAGGGRSFQVWVKVTGRTPVGGTYTNDINEGCRDFGSFSVSYSNTVSVT